MYMYKHVHTRCTLLFIVCAYVFLCHFYGYKFFKQECLLTEEGHAHEAELSKDLFSDDEEEENSNDVNSQDRPVTEEVGQSHILVSACTIACTCTYYMAIEYIRCNVYVLVCTL